MHARPDAASSTLARRLGTVDAVVVGLSAMLGAGVFVAFAPAAAAAGEDLFVSLAIAAVIAFCNAVASAQLASTYPSSGGTYLFGREVLGPWWGFVAGWGFVVGKTASCAAMALTFAAYVAPDGWWSRLVAASAVAVLTMLSLRGVTRTAVVAKVLLACTLSVLIGFVVVVAISSPSAPASPLPAEPAQGTLQAAGLLFFAFAGYARIATLAEDVRRPSVLGRAIIVSLALALLVYAAVGLALVHTLGGSLATSTTPIADAVSAVGADWAQPMVRLGAALATLGALLALMAGVSRTTLAMARERDLPARLAAVDPRFQVPARAQIALGVVIVALVLVVDVRSFIAFSSCGVLVYYAVANLSALRQPASQRRWPRLLQIVGLCGCLTLIATLPYSAVATSLVVLAAGVAARLAREWRERKNGRTRP